MAIHYPSSQEVAYCFWVPLYIQVERSGEAHIGQISETEKYMTKALELVQEQEEKPKVDGEC